MELYSMDIGPVALFVKDVQDIQVAKPISKPFLSMFFDDYHNDVLRVC